MEVLSPVLWSRRAQGFGRRQPTPCDRWQSREGGSHLLDDNGKPHELVGDLGYAVELVPLAS
jgi:hypothetical protein